MDDHFKHFLDSGKKLLRDTKAPRRPAAAAPVKGKKDTGPAQPSMSSLSDDPHAVFVRRVVHEKPKKPEIVEQIKRFIVVAEANL
jgi:hypothetical protein